MIKTLVVGSISAAIAGTTVIAYKWPSSYKKIFPFLLAAATLAVIIVEIYAFSVINTYNSIQPFIEPGKYADAYGAAYNALPNQWIELGGYFGGMFYLCLLYNLPYLPAGLTKNISEDKTQVRQKADKKTYSNKSKTR